MKSRSLTSAALAFLAGGFLYAQAVPGRWEKVDSLKPNSGIVITLKAGDRLEGTFKSSNPDSLTLNELSGGERVFPKSEIRKITSRETHDDPVANGTLIGFGAGAGGFLAVHAAIVPLQEHDAAQALACGGIGALVGLLIDKAVKKPETLYVMR